MDLKISVKAHRSSEEEKILYPFRKTDPKLSINKQIYRFEEL